MSLLIVVRAGGIEYEGINVWHKDGSEVKSYIVKRNIPNSCTKMLITNDFLWTGDYAKSTVPKECKSTYVHTTGKLLPITMREDIETYGELEVLQFIKDMQEWDDMLLIDARKEEWYSYRTIPGAINIPFHHVKNYEDYGFQVEEHLSTMGVEIDTIHPMDFRGAKTILVFCNGPWCTQALKLIYALIDKGYPTEKIIWYRGGIQTWLAAGLTSTRD